MTYDPDRHNRRSIRLRGYDYAQAGAYFVTIVTQDRACLFGDIVDGRMRLNDAGRMVRSMWDAIPAHYPGVATDAFVVMPNHVHGIIVITRETPPAHTVGAGLPRPSTPPLPSTPRRTSPPPNPSTPPRPSPSRPTLGQIIAYFKYQSTKRINAARAAPGTPVWQRNYYEHIIRDEASLDSIRRYIDDNPMNWATDQENPAVLAQTS